MTDTNIHIGTSGGDGLAKLEARVNALTTSLGREILKADAAEAKNRQLATSFKTATTNANTLTVAYNKNESRVASLTASFNALDKRLLAAEAAANKYKKQLVSVTAANAQLTASNKKVSAETKNLGDTFRGAAGGVGKLWFAYGQLLPMMSGFALGSSALQMVKLGAAFEYTTTFVEVLDDAVGSAKVSLAGIQETLLGFDGLRKNANELALGMKEFSKAGVSASEAIGEIEQMARFATLAEIDMSKATELVVGQTNSFGGTFSATANKISAAALSSATTIERMGGAMSYTTELGTVMGFSIDDVATSLALLANKSITGSKAGTALRTSFMKLLAPSKKAKDMMSQLGVEFNALNDDGSIKGLEQQLKEFSAATQSLTEGELAALTRELVGLRSLKGFGNLIHDVDKFDDMKKKISEAANGVGFLSDKVAELDDTNTARWEKLSVNFSNMLTRMNNPTLIKGAIWGMDSIVEGFSKLAQFPDIVLVAPYMAMVNGVQSVMDTVAGVDTTTLTSAELALKEFADAYVSTTEDIYETQSSDHSSWGNSVRESLGLLKVGVEEAEGSSEKFVEIAKNVRIGLGLLTELSDLDIAVDKSLHGFFDEMDAMPDEDLLEISTKNLVEELDAAEAAVQKLADVQAKADAKAAKSAEKAATKQQKLDDKLLAARLKVGQKLDAAQATWAIDSTKREQSLSDLLDEGTGVLSRREARLSEIDSTFADLSSTIESDYLKVEKQYIKVLSDATLGEEERSRVTAERSVSTAAYTSELYNLSIAQVAYTKNDREMILSSGDFWAGMTVGLQDYIDELGTVAEAGQEVFTTAAEAASDSFSTVMTGLIDTSQDTWGLLEDLWETTWKSMLDTVISTVADMSAAFVIDTVASAFFHTGSMGLEADEYNAVLRKGEIVIPAGDSDNIRSNLGSSASFEGIVSATEEATEAQSTASLSSPSEYGKIGELGGAVAGWGLGTASGVTTGATIGKKLGGVLGGYVTENAADAMNVRSYEGLRDALASGVIGEVEARTFQSEDVRTGQTQKTNHLASVVNVLDTVVASTRINVEDMVQSAADALESMRNSVGVYSDSGLDPDNQGLAGGGKLDDDGDSASWGFTAGRDSGNDTSNQGSAGGGKADDDGGNAGWGFSEGGVVDRLIVPRGDDGIGGLSFGEGVVDKDTMKLLSAALRSDKVEPTTQELTIPIYIGDKYLTTQIVTIADNQISVRQKQGNPRGVVRI